MIFFIFLMNLDFCFNVGELSELMKDIHSMAPKAYDHLIKYHQETYSGPSPHSTPEEMGFSIFEMNLDAKFNLIHHIKNLLISASQTKPNSLNPADEVGLVRLLSLVVKDIKTQISDSSKDFKGLGLPPQLVLELYVNGLKQAKLSPSAETILKTTI